MGPIFFRATACVLYALASVGAWAQQIVSDAAPESVLEKLVNEQYAYLERFDTGQMPTTEKLRQEAAAADTEKAKLKYAERALLMLADDHAITRNSLPDSWGLSSKSDLWVEISGRDYVVTAVRDGSPAYMAGIVATDRVIAVGGVAIDEAVKRFWHDLGSADETNPSRNAFAARILITGRRDRPRELTIQDNIGTITRHSLPNLYMVSTQDRDLVEVQLTDARYHILINDSLGNNDTIAAFDSEMKSINDKADIVLDLRNTASGGNTTVARAIMGWFTDREGVYQVHTIPAEERRFGVARKWRELVLPRDGKFHSGLVEVRVGRWTGSMGEGIAIGMDALGHHVCGGPMAGLLGAVYDLDLPDSKVGIKLPVERLTAADGMPRENFISPLCSD